MRATRRCPCIGSFVRLLSSSLLFIAVLGGARPLPAGDAAPAQASGITGRVIDAESREPLPGVVVDLVTGGGRTLATTTSEDDGSFALRGVAPGRYSLLFTTLGFEVKRLDRVSVQGATTRVGTIELVSNALRLNPVVVTVSREQEKALESPASVYTIDSKEVEDRPSTTSVDHLIGLPGADIFSTGLSQHNVAARGFNNVFSAALFVLTDNRWASVPSLRFNAYNLIPATNEDIERIEFVLGPGSALYGPNVDKGVVHIITRSPLDHQGTTVSLTGGERSLFQGALRHAGLIGENIGYKVSGLYMRGDDWRYDDPLEIVPRDYEQQRLQGDIRFDVRFDEQSTLVLSGGASRLIRSIEQIQIGSAQAIDWTYSYLQGRFRRGSLFAQAYVNFSDAGDTFTMRDADTITDNSFLYAAQIQHGVSLGERQRFIYGADLIRTVPRTGGTIMGRNEDDDDVTELGGYVQSETRLAPRFDLVIAGRVDYHSTLDKALISPRAAFVFNPTPYHRLRLTYNRAFSQPETNMLTLDRIVAPDLEDLPYPLRARAAPQSGFTFRRDCVTSLGDSGLCMRSPFSPGVLDQPVSTSLPLDATLLWDAVVQIIAAEDEQLGALLAVMAPPDASQVGTVIKLLNPTTERFEIVSDVADVPQMKSSITNSIEVGYKGLIGDRLLLGVDVYYSHIKDHQGPLLVETPNAFMEPGSLLDYIVSEAQRLNLPLDETTAAILAGVMSTVPVATVTPEQVGESDAADILLTYHNFPTFELWGTDLGLTLLLGDHFSFSGSYSFLSQNFFPADELGGLTDLSLNSPRNKASLSGRYSSERLGLAAELRGRWIEGFRVASGVYVGSVKSYTLVDAQLAYTLPMSRSTQITLNALNLLTFHKAPGGESVSVFNGRHREMVGAPELGRLLTLRVRQSF
jgi:outer membrane receptor for ferrienterochelin and colicins